MVFKGGRAYEGKQGPNYAPGVSAEASGSRGLWMGTVVIPPGGRTKAHLHEAHESAVHVLRGTIRVYHGQGLEAEPLTSNAGDYVFIPAGVPHVAVNASQGEEAVAILARTDASEQESVVLLPELDSVVPA
jgi:uncharacterized RmlC-like cupin family protein